MNDPHPNPESVPGEPVPQESADDGATEPVLETPPAPTRRGIVMRVVLALLLGVLVAALGTATHRTVWNDLPVGLVLALALTASTAVLCRAWAGLATLAGAAAGWVLAVEILSLTASGGDVLIVDPAATIRFAQASVVWSWGGIVVLGVVAFLPRRWFARR